MRTLLLLLLLALAACAPASLPKQAPGYPRVMILPQPDDQVSFQVDGLEWLRYHYGEGMPKPYFYPVMGPAGAPVTRITHPHDPHSHNHHLSLWIGHEKIGGVSFWGHNRNPSRIVFDHIRKIEDGDRASLTILGRWLDGDRKPLLLDERIWTLSPRFDTIGGDGFGEYMLDLELKLTPTAPSLTIGKTPFGFAAVRVAKMMGTADGGGTIRNSEGRINEEQLMPHRRARWCDYSGTPRPGAVNGVTLMDHPSNPNHPTYFHVRRDGWMGSSFSFDGDVVITKEKPLVVRYRYYVHRGAGDPKALDAEWEAFAR
jgi:hypothetical protein